MAICLDKGRVIPGVVKKHRSVELWPHTLIVDTREQSPFGFHGFEAKSPNDELIPFVINTERATLESGDYSVKGFEPLISVERKSLEDLYGTLGGGRERFERELERLNQMDFAAVVTEAPWARVMEGIDGRRLSPESVFGSIISFQQRFVRVHWWMCQSRRDAETITFRILRRFVEANTKGAK